MFNVFFELYYQKWSYISLSQQREREDNRSKKKECFLSLALSNAADAKFWKHKNVPSAIKSIYKFVLALAMLGVLVTSVLYACISFFALQSSENTMIPPEASSFFIFVIALLVLMPNPEALTIVKRDIKQSAGVFVAKTVQPLQDCCAELGLDFQNALPWLLSELENYKSLYEENSFTRQVLPQIRTYALPVFSFFAGRILGDSFPASLLLMLFLVTVTLVIIFIVLYSQIVTFIKHTDKTRECMEDLRQAIQFCQHNK